MGSDLISMPSGVGPLSAAGTQEAQRLLRDANITTNSSKRLIHRVRSKLQAPKSDVTVSTVVHYVDNGDTRSLSVLQTLLQALQSQVSPERFQSVRRRLLVIAAKHGHAEILEHLLVIGANIDHSHGEALQDAVLFGHVSCVEVLLHNSPSIHAVQRALLTTDFVELDQARVIIQLLLNSKLPRSILDYLRLKMYAGPPDDFDSEILAMLVAATNRSSLQGDIQTINNLSNLYTYFEIQRQVRGFLLYYTATSHTVKTYATSVQVADLRQPKRNIFGDETIKSPENLILRLLERYIKGCSTREGVEIQWPLSTVDLLLDRMPSGTEELPEYARCLSLAANFQQTTVFTRLLHHRTLSITALRSLSLHAIVRNVEMVVALLDRLNQYHLSDKVHLEIVKPLFIHACEAQLLPRAVQICSRSRVPISISTILQYLKVAIAHDENIQDISDLLKVAKVEHCDLDLLWGYVLAPANFPINTARILLQAGYNSPVVAKSFLRCVRFNEKLANLSMILDEWRIPKTLDLRNSFDYRTRKPAKTRQPAIIDPRHQYFHTLAAALQIGIEHQQFNLCQLLLEKGASPVLDGTSLLEKAVFWGTKYPSLDQDKVLNLIFNTEKTRTDPQSVLDFTLLQAVKCLRHQIVAELVIQGASTLAYGHECWHLAFYHKSELLLRSLLTTVRSRAELSQNFKAIFTSFTSDPETLMSLSSRVHQAGFADSDCYMWMSQVLCQRKKLTAQSLEQLIVYGAFQQQALDQCLDQCWRYDNLPALRVLFEKGISQRAAESIFQSILRDCAASTTVLCSADGVPLARSRAEIVFGAMTMLLRMKMPQRSMNMALCSVAFLSDEPVSLRIPALITLLQNGAKFTEDNGLALLHCFLVDDQMLMQQVNASRPPAKARQAALHFVLHFPSGMGEPAPSHRFHALAQLLYPPLSTPKITLTDRNIMSITGMFLSPRSNTPTTLIHHFYGWLRTQSPIRVCDREHCLILEKKLTSIIEGLVGMKDMLIHFIERITAVLCWVRPATESTTTPPQSFSFFRISVNSLSQCLIASSKAGLIPIVGALLEAGTSPNVFDASGKSALSWAASENKPDMVKFLINAGAHPDDGSLHEATCHQRHAVMEVLLNSGHDQGHISALHDNMTSLLAFVHFDHAKSNVRKFSETINKLRQSTPINRETCSTVKSAVEAAMSNQYAFQLILALLPWLKLCFDADSPAIQAPISKGPLKYSLLSLIDLWQYSFLTRSERNSLVLSLQGIGFDEMFYTTEGDQPANAVNVPEAIRVAEETRKRHSAFLTKECCIHGERAEDENDIHAGLSPTCAVSHGWKNDIVCTDCLKQYLETRMFPHDDIAIKYKFPSTKIPCWAPKCPTTELPYNVLQEYSDPEIFHLYDLALCQALLREGKSMVKCATSECPGAHWYDDSDEDENLKIFFCEICFQNTCTECNDLYEKHDNQPCPAGEEARKCERIKKEEKLSEEALKLEKRCPKCKLMYQKYMGCDHVVCGKNVYDYKVDSKLLSLVCSGVYSAIRLVSKCTDRFTEGCRFEFCDICFGAWPGGHTRTCIHRF